MRPLVVRVGGRQDACLNVLFGVLFTGLDNVAMYQNGQIKGMAVRVVDNNKKRRGK